MPTVYIGEASRQWAHDLDDLRDRWAIRHELPIEQDWMPVAVFAQACVLLEEADLLALRAGVLEIHHAIKKRISHMNADRHKRGIWADPDMWNELQAAKAATARHLVVVNDALGLRKHEMIHAREEAFGQRFILVAKRRLPTAEFLEWIDEAKNGSAEA